MKVYVSGPMSGIKGNNVPAFDAATARLQALDVYVVSPADMDRDDGLRPTRKVDEEERRQLLKRDLLELMTCDAIYMLDGWLSSHGAYLEHQVAKELGLLMMYEREV